MYVRTKKGEIFDCYESEQMHKSIYYPKKSKTNGYIDYEDVYKKSDNIIDILQVGDYVNGEQVSRIKQCPEYHLGDGILIFNEHNETIYSNFRTSKYYDITSILTKEQFESMEYRIGE